MILESLSLTNFKNIAGCNLSFSPKINCFLGNNGVGKSNLLDAIHYLSFCKSFSGLPDPMLIRRGEDFAIVRGHYLRNNVDEEVTAGLATGRRKSFKRSGKEYKRLSEHIGLFPLVMVAPADSELINGSGDVRRRFIDMLISQADAPYLEALIRYNRLLTQRNAMLRDGIADAGLYAAVDMQMDMAADRIYNTRAKYVSRLSEIFARYYNAISDSRETPTLVYRSHLSGGQSLAELLETNRDRDRIVKHTSVGPHRDDIEMILDEMPARQTASQGQSKTYTISLRLAQYEFLKSVSGMSPLLLLDDIFDKLDSARVGRIMNIAASDTFGQIFVTDTNRQHLDEIIALTGGRDAIWSVSDGSFNRITSSPS